MYRTEYLLHCKYLTQWAIYMYNGMISERYSRPTSFKPGYWNWCQWKRCMRFRISEQE